MRPLSGTALHALGGASPGPPGLLLPLFLFPHISQEKSHPRAPLHVAPFSVFADTYTSNSRVPPPSHPSASLLRSRSSLSFLDSEPLVPLSCACLSPAPSLAPLSSRASCVSPSSCVDRPARLQRAAAGDVAARESRAKKGSFLSHEVAHDRATLSALRSDCGPLRAALRGQSGERRDARREGGAAAGGSGKERRRRSASAEAKSRVRAQVCRRSSAPYGTARRYDDSFVRSTGLCASPRPPHASFLDSRLRAFALPSSCSPPRASPSPRACPVVPPCASSAFRASPRASARPCLVPSPSLPSRCPSACASLSGLSVSGPRSVFSADSARGGCSGRRAAALAAGERGSLALRLRFFAREGRHGEGWRRSSAPAACDSGAVRALATAKARSEQASACLAAADSAEREDALERGADEQSEAVAGEKRTLAGCKLYRHDGRPQEGEFTNSQGLSLHTYTWWPCRCNTYLEALKKGENCGGDGLPATSTRSSTRCASSERPGGREGEAPRAYRIGERGELQRDAATGRIACAACQTPIDGVILLVHGYGEHCRSHFLQRLQDLPRARPASRDTSSRLLSAESDRSRASRASSASSPSPYESSSADGSPPDVSSAASSSVDAPSSDLPSPFAPAASSALLGRLFYEGSWVHGLNAQGFLVVGFDLQGHGLSGGWRGLRCVVAELDDFARDVLQFVLLTQRRFAVPPAGAREASDFPMHVLGLSMGGWAAARALELAACPATLRALQRPQRDPGADESAPEGDADAASQGGCAADVSREGGEPGRGERRPSASGVSPVAWAAPDATRGARRPPGDGETLAGLPAEDESATAETKGAVAASRTGERAPASAELREPLGEARRALGLTGLVLLSPMFDMERRKAKLKWELAKYGILPLAAFFPGVPLDLFAPWRRLKKDRKRKVMAEYEQLRQSFEADPLTFKESPPGGLVAAIMRDAQRALEAEEVAKISRDNVQKVLILHNAKDSICDIGGAVQFFERLGSRGAAGEGVEAVEKALIILNVEATEEARRDAGARREGATQQRRAFEAFLAHERARRSRDCEAALPTRRGKEKEGDPADDSRRQALQLKADGAEGRPPPRRATAGARPAGSSAAAAAGGEEAAEQEGDVEQLENSKESVRFVEGVNVWHNLANEPGHARVLDLIQEWVGGDGEQPRRGGV